MVTTFSFYELLPTQSLPKKIGSPQLHTAVRVQTFETSPDRLRRVVGGCLSFLNDRYELIDHASVLNRDTDLFQVLWTGAGECANCLKYCPSHRLGATSASTTCMPIVECKNYSNDSRELYCCQL